MLLLSVYYLGRVSSTPPYPYTGTSRSELELSILFHRPAVFHLR